MRMPGAKAVLFNAAALLVTVGALAAVVRSLVYSPAMEPCTQRYSNSTAFALERGGVVLMAADLQSGVGGRDAGVIENVTINRIKNAPSPLVMTVSLAKGAGSAHGSMAAKGGVSFPWQPRAVQGKTAACLSYQVLLPADFESGRGGALPGIQGVDATERSEDGFVARMAWRDGGSGGATNRLTEGGVTRSSVAEREPFALPRGRWVKLEQEVVLNTPKQADGILRVWVDGKLAIDRAGMDYRAREDITLAGVAADVFYGTEEGVGSAPKDTKISLTPFEVRWK